MLEELQRRNLSPITTRIYLRSVEEFAETGVGDKEQPSTSGPRIRCPLCVHLESPNRRAGLPSTIFAIVGTVYDYYENALAGPAFKNGGYRHHSALESRLHALINDPDDDDDDVISILREEFDLECSPRSELGIDAPDQRYPPTSCRVSSCNVIGELFDHSHVGGDNPSHEIADRYHADNSFSFKYG
jgi:hypothetical protein